MADDITRKREDDEPHVFMTESELWRSSGANGVESMPNCVAWDTVWQRIERRLPAVYSGRMFTYLGGGVDRICTAVQWCLSGYDFVCDLIDRIRTEWRHATKNKA